MTVSKSHSDAIDPASKLRLRSPDPRDGARIWALVRDSGSLDLNSCYLYLLLARDFAATCVVAERERDSDESRSESGEILGFVSAYLRPEQPDTVFVWQVGVAEAARRQGLARRMLDHLLARDACRSVCYLEATVSESNAASRRLFQSLARDRAATHVYSSGFTSDMFGSDQHEPEPLLRIGPFPPSI